MLNKTSFIALRGLAALSLCFAFGLARAQDNGPDADPPDRAGRLSFLQGEVSLQPAGEDDWADAIVNRPLTTGDKLWTDQGARAEIQVGQASVRLGSDTGFSFLNVDDDTIQMRITAGVINVHVVALDGNDQIEIDTPNLALSVLRPGNYRVEVNDAGDTSVVKVSEGEAEASGGSQNVIVHAQQSVTFRGADQLSAQFGSLGAPDEFDSWSLERERRDERAATSRTAQYVSPDVTGYEDLDSNGSWSSEDEYGYVWTPRSVAVGWSPYQDGRWAWVAPWGWTWIDDAPWGYAPFHYGRWAHVRERWCWVPGPRHVRAVYAPALVGWVGSPGLNVSISVGGGGGVAWFPLGPREVYVPARRYSSRYVERVNVSNTVIVNRTYITNVYDNRTNLTYRNRTVPGAVTAVSRTTFTSAQRVGGQRIRMDDRVATGTTAMAPHIEPVRESRMGERDARRSGRAPPQTVVNRQVVVKRSPPPASAHFARNGSDVDSRREPSDPSRRPTGSGIDANTRPDLNRNAAQPPDGNRTHAERDARNGQNTQENRVPQVREHTDRPQRIHQPQVEGAAPQTQQPQSQPQADGQLQQRERQDRQQQGRQLQERRQAELQTRQQRDAEQQQRAATQQAEQRQHGAERQNAERANTERANTERANADRASADRQNRPAPQKPAESKPEPQKRQVYKDRRERDDDQKN
jgi:FecR protein